MKFIPSVSSGVFNANERNDCVVRAITNVSGKPYDEVHTLLKKHGREDRKGTSWPVTLKVMQELGYSGCAVGNSRSAVWFEQHGKVNRHEQNVTLSKVIKDLPAGKYVVYVTGHATALIDGKIIDTFDNKAKKQVSAVFWDNKQFDQSE